jgi:hypothetical protein
LGYKNAIHIIGRDEYKMGSNRASTIQKFKLKQITPMIHFQHDEDGACLRPSEVKPKLDNFIIKWCEGKKIAIPDSWYINAENKANITALKYKMRIKGVGNSKSANPHKLYFGNIDKEKKGEEYIKTVYYPDGMEMTIVCFCKDTTRISTDYRGHESISLPKLIEFVLPAFFNLHCFGTRSRKGFGSFMLERNPDGSKPRTSPEYLGLFCPEYYYIQYKIDVSRNINDIMDDIWVISGMMKSGFNLTNKQTKKYYYKGNIFKYFTDKGIGGDKAFIKQKVLTGKDDNKGSELYKKYGEFRFTRAMLGLTQNYTFRRFKDMDRNIFVGNVGIENDSIKRFASPILFKPHGTRLYIIPQNIPDVMFGAEFELNNKTLKTPTKEEFNLMEFLDWFVVRYNDYSRNEHKEHINYAVKPTIDKKLEIKTLH